MPLRAAPFGGGTALVKRELAVLIGLTKNSAMKNEIPKPPAATTLSGTVARCLPNPRGEVDGLLLQDGTIVKFPPHLAEELTQVATVGAKITVNGHPEGKGLLKGHVVFNPATGHALREIKPAPPERAGCLPAMQPLRVEGTVHRVKHNGHGDADGAVLADGTVLQFPPHAGKQFAALLVEGGALCASGFGSEGPHGRCVAVAMFGAKPGELQMIVPPHPKPGKDHEKPGKKEKRPADAAG